MLSGAILRTTKVLRQHQSLRHIGILLSGKVGVHLIALLSQPVLARIYTPTQFGEFAFINSLLAVLLIGSSGRFEEGIVLTRTPQQASRLFQLSQTLLLGYLLLISLGIIMAPETILSWISRKGISRTYLYLLPFLILAGGYWQIVQNWLTRFKQFSKISLTLIIQRLLIFAGAILAFIFPGAGNGLVFGIVLGSIGLCILAISLHKEPFTFFVKGFKSYAHHFREFPLYSVPALYVLSFTQHLPVFWIGTFYDQNITGLYSMAFTLVNLPFALLNMSTYPIYYEHLAQSPNQTRIKIIHKYLRFFFVTLLPFSLIIFLYGESIAVFTFGQKWEQTGKIASLLAPIGFFQGLGSCLLIPLTVLRKQSFSLFFQSLRLIFWVIALVAGIIYKDIFLSFALMSILSMVHFIILSAVVYPLIKRLMSGRNRKKATRINTYN